MTASGTFETCQGGLMVSVVRGRPEVTGTQPTDAIDPKRQSSKDQVAFQDARDRVLYE